MSDEMSEAATRGWRDDATSVSALKARIAAFNAARAWSPFHHPKDVAMCIAAEAAELLEVFLWQLADEEPDMDRVREELADVVISAANLAVLLDVDVMAAVDRKLVQNAEKYPAEATRAAAIARHGREDL